MEICPLVSIILPVYNVAGYLAICLDSVLAQSYRNWELLAIDDKSEDGSLAILQDYAARDKRIQVHALQSNQGVSKARNLAFAKARGSWLMFIDGDDILHKDTLAKSVAIGEQQQVDIVLWNIYNFQNVDEPRIMRYKESPHDPINASHYFLNWPVLAGVPFSVREHRELCEALFVCPFHSPVNKLFRHSLLLEHKLEFAPVYHEDIVFTNLAFLHARRLVWLDRGLYYYRKRPKDAQYLSLTQDHSLLKSLDSLVLIYREMQRLGVLSKAISGFVRFLYKGTVPGIVEFPALAPQWYPKVRSFWLEVAQHSYSTKFLPPSYKRHLAYLLSCEHLEDYLGQIAKHPYLSWRLWRYLEEIIWVLKTRVDIRYSYYKPLARYSLGLFNLLFVNPNTRNRAWHIKFCLGLLNPLHLILSLFQRYWAR